MECTVGAFFVVGIKSVCRDKCFLATVASQHVESQLFRLFGCLRCSSAQSIVVSGKSI